MYRSYNYNNMPEPVMPAQQTAPVKESTQKREAKKPELGADDLILMLVAALLLMNECDDKPLLLALAYVFISDRM